MLATAPEGLKVITEAKRCRDVYRYFPRDLDVLDLTSALESSEDTPLPPLDFKPIASTDTSLKAFAQLTAIRLNAARCLISLVDTQHQYIIVEAGPKSGLGEKHVEADLNELWLGNVVIPRRRGVCGQVIDHALNTTADDGQPRILVIPDLAAHELYGSERFVGEHPGWKFFAGAPLCTLQGSPIGAICVFDHRPRVEGLTVDEAAVMTDMAATTMKLLISHRNQHDFRRGERMVRGLTDFVEGATSLRANIVDGKTWEFPDVHILEARGATDSVSTSKSSQVGLETTSTAYKELSRSPSPHVEIVSEAVPILHEDTRSKDLRHEPSREMRDGPATVETAAQLQESILPAKAKALFSRAANVMRQTSELDGVVFFDASIAAIGAKNPRTAFASARSMSADARSIHTLRRGGSSSRASTNSTDTHSSSESSGQSRPKDPERMSQVLGFSGLHRSSVLGHSAQRFLPESVLKRLLRWYPSGKIINFDANGEATTSSEDAVSADILSLGEEALATKQRSSKRVVNHRRTMEAIRIVAPDARSICLLPLWDYERSRWFSFCLLWTTQPDRLLSADVDLVYLKAFGNSVMTELARLDEITSGRVKTNFVAAVSHELRSPLHGVLGGIELLRNTELDAFQIAMIHSISTCGRTLLDVINHVLDFTKMNDFETGIGSNVQLRDDNTVYVSSRGSRLGSMPKLDQFHLVSNLRSVTEEVVESVFASQSYHIAQTNMEDEGVEVQGTNHNSRKPEHVRKQVLLVLDIGKEATTKLRMPSGAWRRILLNLVGNSLKYTQSGFIKVGVRVSETGQKLDSKNSRVFLTVSDSGIGMSKDFLVNRIFTPFTQENSFSSGVGLGLNLVRQIVDSLRGTIKVRSVLGQGSDITISLDLPSTDGRSTSDVEDPLTEIVHRLRSKKVCVLYAACSSTSTQAEAANLFGDSICKTLSTWLGVEPTRADDWNGQDADIIIITEPSFELLASVRGTTLPGQQIPITLMVAIDAVEAEALRNDARVLSLESIVGIISQPCGPYKLAKVLDHCLDRIERSASRDISSQDSGFGGETPPAMETPTLKDIAPPPPFGENYSLSEEQNPQSQCTYTVIIADDNPINRRLLIALMNKYRLAYYEAVDGLRALRIYQQHHQNIDCVLMDISMPIMDGMTSTRRIRAFEAQNKIPRTTIVALTGLVSASARLEALESGVDKFMTKPVNFAELRRLMPGLPQLTSEGEDMVGHGEIKQSGVQEVELLQSSSESDKQ